jgi:hypothetical protein
LAKRGECGLKGLRETTGVLALVGLVLGSSVAGWGCDFCLLSQGVSPLDTISGEGVKVAERYTLLDRVYSGTDKLPGMGARETHWTTELTGFYSPLPRLTLIGVVPYRIGKTSGELALNADGTVAELDTAGAGSADGIGDVALLGRYTFLTTDRLAGTTRVAAQLGVKLATGSTDAKTDNGAEYLDSHLQPGTGSTDFLFGLSLSHALTRLSFTANLLGTLPGEGEFGDTKHQFGAALNFDVSAKYRVHPGTAAPRAPQFFIVLGVVGEARDKEKVDGVADENSGGTTLYVAPGAQLTLARHWIVDITYQAAVYHNLGGTQLGETAKAIGGVTYLF